MQKKVNDIQSKILTVLKKQPKGLTVIETAKELNLGRNTVAKYLELLALSGKAEMRKVGAAKIFFLSRNVPISAMMNFAKEFFVVIDNNKRIIDVNKSLLSFVNKKKKDIIGKNLYEANLGDFINDEERHRIRKNIKEALLYNEKNIEVSFTKDKKKYYFNTKYIPTMLYDGSKGVTVIAEDITEEKIAQEKLKQSERLYKAVVEDQTELICRFKPDGTITFVNKVYCTYFKKKQEQLIGSSFMPLIPNEDQKKVYEAFSSLSKDNLTITYEHRVTAPDGSIRWQKWTDRAIIDSKGNIAEYQSVGRDITKQKEYEFALLDRKNFETLIIELSSLLVQIKPNEKDNKIQEALMRIGTFADVDRSYVFLLSEDKKITDNTHEWCRKGIKPEKDNLQNLSVDMVPWWMNKLNNFKTIYIPKVAELPKEAQPEKEILEQQDIKSLVAVPLIHGKELLGFMGFDSVQKVKKWSNSEIVLLKIVAQLIVNTLKVD